MISNMIKENIYYTLGNEFTTWSTCILERCAGFIVYPLTLIVILIILNYPLVFGLFEMYVLNAIFFVWKKIGNLPEDIDSKKWDKPKKILTLVFEWHGKILHRINLFLALHYTVHTTRENIVNLLKQGNHVTVAPGGLQEQNYGNNHYQLIWGKRRGFAHIAINAKVPIIPVFTQNTREAYTAYGNIRPMRWLYEQTRWFIFPLYGMFPVKLITHIGKPIPYDPDITAEQLAEKTQKAIETLRDKHQKIPGSILHSIRQRLETANKEKQ